MAMNPLDFLQSIAGFTQSQTAQQSANRPFKLGTIDPAYVASSFPGTLPKVTFDGESTLSGKLYPVMAPYKPQPSDRVVLAPVGNTYVILGPLDYDTAAYVGGVLRVAGAGDLSLTSTGHGFQVGPDSGLNLAMDQNEIQARNNGAASTLIIQADSGNTAFNGNAADPTTNTVDMKANLIVQGALTVGGVTPGNVTQQVFTTSGTWTKPAGARAVRFQVQGGGGAGGGGPATGAGAVSAGAGGQGGAYAESTIAASTLTATVAITIGAGGTGVSGTTGNSGGTSSAAAYVSAAGGAGGPIIGASGSVGASNGGGGAQAMTGDVQVDGSGGGAGVRLGTSSMGGHGGNSFLGGGAKTCGSNAQGDPGGNYGGGGAGSARNQSQSAIAGGAGAPGIVIVTTYF